MESLFYKSLLDITGIAGCVLETDGSISAISRALAELTGLEVGAKLTLSGEAQHQEVRCFNSDGEWVFDALCLNAEGSRWLVRPLTAERDETSELDSLAHALRREIMVPLDCMAGSLLELTVALESAASAEPQLLDKVRTIRQEALRLQDKALDYWSLFSVQNTCPVRGEERLEPRQMIERALAQISICTEVYLKAEADLGVVYGSRRWLVAALRALVGQMVAQHSTQRLSCELRQCNDELLITFQDIGMLTPGNQEPWRMPAGGAHGVEPLIDTELATRALRMHGGVVRYNSGAEIARLIISLPTGAPGQKDLALLLDQTEAELTQMSACINKGGRDD